MIEKYTSVRTDVLNYIANRIELNIPVSVIAKEVYNKYPVFVAFYTCSTAMVIEFIEWIVFDCYFWKKANKDPLYSYPDGNGQIVVTEKESQNTGNSVAII